MKIVILGAGGRLGAALMREYRGKYDVEGFNHTQLDLSNLNGVRERLRATNFDVLINAAAFTNVDLCETERDRAFLINAEAPGMLARICCDKRAKLIHFSTDYVFDGEKRAPYSEEDEAKPISVYGKSKLAGEKNVLATENQHLVVRVSWVFGPDRPSFVDGIIKRAQENGEVDAIADKFSAPTYTVDIAEMVGRVLDAWSRRAVAPDGLRAGRLQGIVHFANAGECSWQGYGQWALDRCHEAGLPLKATNVDARKLKDMANWVARRPVYSVLSTAKYTKFTDMPPRTWRDAVADYITRFYSKT
ncbi:MAG TPA: dTDP-4-dehydrorhamnose reductase [Candidatus Udaeobacter sp.]|nr:dTDP-4-dehydrorhamnose reductase [Candidatus Udaeobacter sp.]